MARRFLILLAAQLLVLLVATVTPALTNPCEPVWREGRVTGLLHYPSDKQGSLNYNVPARWVIEVEGEDGRLSFAVQASQWAWTSAGDDAVYTDNCAGYREVVTISPRGR